LLVGASPVSGAVGDFDGDGTLDLAVANVGGDNVSILINRCHDGGGCSIGAAPSDNRRNLLLLLVPAAVLWWTRQRRGWIALEARTADRAVARNHPPLPVQEPPGGEFRKKGRTSLVDQLPSPRTTFSPFFHHNLTPVQSSVSARLRTVGVYATFNAKQNQVKTVRRTGDMKKPITVLRRPAFSLVFQRQPDDRFCRAEGPRAVSSAE
jgi:hypothetical protein